MSEVKKTRSLSGYMVFTMQERKSVEQTMPNLKFADISRELGKRWKALSDADKDSYNKKGKETLVEVKEKKAKKSATPAVEPVATKTSKKGGKKAAAVEEVAPVTKKGAKKTKAVKDESKPKRGKNAFMYFLDEHRTSTRAELEASGQKAGITDITKQVSLKWKALTEEQKAPFVAKSKSQQPAK